MPPRRGGICGRLGQDLPSTRHQGDLINTDARLEREQPFGDTTPCRKTEATLPHTTQSRPLQGNIGRTPVPVILHGVVFPEATRSSGHPTRGCIPCSGHSTRGCIPRSHAYTSGSLDAVMPVECPRTPPVNPSCFGDNTIYLR